MDKAKIEKKASKKIPEMLTKKEWLAKFFGGIKVLVMVWNIKKYQEWSMLKITFL